MSKKRLDIVVRSKRDLTLGEGRLHAMYLVLSILTSHDYGSRHIVLKKSQT